MSCGSRDSEQTLGKIYSLEEQCRNRLPESWRLCLWRISRLTEKKQNHKGGIIWPVSNSCALSRGLKQMTSRGPLQSTLPWSKNVTEVQRNFFKEPPESIHMYTLTEWEIKQGFQYKQLLRMFRHQSQAPMISTGIAEMKQGRRLPFEKNSPNVVHIQVFSLIAPWNSYTIQDAPSFLQMQLPASSHFPPASSFPNPFSPQTVFPACERLFISNSTTWDYLVFASFLSGMCHLV